MKAAIQSFALSDRNSRRRLSALPCLALFLVLEIFAGSGVLHKSIHADSAAPGHHCVITLLAQGQVHAPAAALGWVAFVSVFLFCLPLTRAALVSSFVYRLCPSRGPPRF
jgi:hypothetical protein